MSISSPWVKKISNIHVLKCSRLTIFFLLCHDPITSDSDDFSPPFDRELENNYTPEKKLPPKNLKKKFFALKYQVENCQVPP